MPCQGHDVRIQRERLQQGSFTAIFYFRRRFVVGVTRFQTRTIGTYILVPVSHHVYCISLLDCRVVDQSSSSVTALEV